MGQLRQKPKYEHDCNYCIFLGQYKDKDLYFCDGHHPTVIARNSSDPPDYQSGLTFVGIINELTEAAKRAVDNGFLDKTIKTGCIDGMTVEEAFTKEYYK